MSCCGCEVTKVFDRIPLLQQASEVDWNGRIIATTDDVQVVDKPAGVPTIPTVDNVVESAVRPIPQCMLILLSQIGDMQAGVCTAVQTVDHLVESAVILLN